MLLCPPNLCKQLPEKQGISSNRNKCQTITITLMVLQFIYMMLTFNNINQLNENEIIIANQNCLDENGIDFNNLRIYNSLFFECYIPVLAYFILSLFCCQLCMVDKKLTGYRNRLIKKSFRLRLIIRIIFQFIIAIIVILQFVEIMIMDQQITTDCTSQSLNRQFDSQIFIPCTINLLIFLILVIFDNTYYYLIVCLTNDLYWGCYHDEELPMISVVETQSFSFAKQSTESGPDLQISDDQPTPYFGI